MSWFWNLNLIHCFNFYLGLTFLASTFMRINQYRAIIGLVRDFAGRWPKLFQLVRQHGHIFVTWSTAMPALVALGLFLVNLIASKAIWPHVDLTPASLFKHWLVLPLVITFGFGMLAFDIVGTFWVGEVDRVSMQKYFDQAEYWLSSWTAPVVHFFTLGHINPRKMVATEVQKSLVQASELINTTLWWVVVQVALRIAFGLSLWLTYAWSILRA
jgi:hypothetical protein